MYDLIIVGAGPAGLSAALTACYFKMKFIVLESNTSGGALSQVYPWKEVESFLGLKGLSGKEVAERITKHVLDEGAEIKECEGVTDIKREKDFIRVKTTKSEYKTRSVILAIGTIGTPRRLNVPGENLNGVYYHVKDPYEFKGKNVIVVGGGDSAVENAIALQKAGAHVILIHRRDELRCMDRLKKDIEKSGVKILWNTEVKEIIGKNKVESVKAINNKTFETKDITVDSVFIFIGSVLNTDFLKKIGIKLDSEHIVVDKNLKTNLEGVFAAGDITGCLKRIPQAIAQGELATYSAYKYLKHPYWE